MPFISVDDSVSQSYNYVLVGGGTAGLTLAARLSEDPSVSVLVLEAGSFNPGDQLISRPVQYGAQLGQDAYAWSFKTVPQKNVAGRQVGWDRGKVLGGSSAINFSVWTNPAKGDIDDWEKLGNIGWNWGNFSKYPSLPPAALQHNLNDGVAWKPGAYQRTALVNLGVPKAPLPLDGDPHGTFFTGNTLDPLSYSRSYSTDFYLRNSDRPNLSILLSACATKVTFSDAEGDLTATGVEFIHGSKTHLVRGNKEVILCLGALKTPHLLELSGIGRPDVLKQAGITPRLDLPVGENVQEHVFASLSYELKDSVTDDTLDVLGDEVERQKQIDLHARGEGVFNMGIVNFAFLPLSEVSPRSDAIYSRTINSIEEKIAQGKYPVGATETLKMQIQKVGRNVLDCEITTIPGFLSGPNPPRPGKKHFNIFCMNNSLFSRGTAHITSSDPQVHPAYDPRYFEDEADLEALIETVKFARKVCRTAPFKDVLDEEPVEVNPGPNVQTDEELGAWVKQMLTSTWHTVGSASMLPKGKGGVVDSKLKVYGTTNLRIVDLSIAPILVAAHTQSLAYGIAEQAADIIKGVI
ncbi:hypothetical protein F5146DRAFT_1225783 [Armillaria mellea]|nr:hypothetical protein F5146DRAFT_1225783 [Armillaria mellea]